MADNNPFYLTGAVVGGCSCDWGCPCNFEMPPTQGFCEGEYVWCVEQGAYNGANLDNLNFGMFFRSPAAIHLGDLTTAVIIDERADQQQRQAIEDMVRKTEPFSIFMDLTSNFLGTRYAPFEVKLDGIHSAVRIPGIYDLQMTPMTNPVTGEPELATLLKPTGFTSQRQELCTTTVERFSVEGLSYEYSGKYAEFCNFEYGQK